jgi:hypothetical protein
MEVFLLIGVVAVFGSILLDYCKEPFHNRLGDLCGDPLSNRWRPLCICAAKAPDSTCLLRFRLVRRANDPYRRKICSTSH